MRKNIGFWKEFWASQETPLHRYNDEGWYKLYAEEINLLLDSLNYKQGNVLEMGCGNGALFPYLKINRDDYLGIDFSAKLLSAFQQNHPQTRLICSDASSFTIQNSFSLIFSNGVVQYFDPKSLDRHIQNCLNMLKPDGVLLVMNIPLKSLMWQFYAGEFHKIPSKFNALRAVKTFFKRIFNRQWDMGYWYSPKDFIKWQEKDISVVLFGSLFHPYRFSVALKYADSKYTN